MPNKYYSEFPTGQEKEGKMEKKETEWHQDGEGGKAEKAVFKPKDTHNPSGDVKPLGKQPGAE